MPKLQGPRKLIQRWFSAVQGGVEQLALETCHILWDAPLGGEADEELEEGEEDEASSSC